MPDAKRNCQVANKSDECYNYNITLPQVCPLQGDQSVRKEDDQNPGTQLLRAIQWKRGRSGDAGLKTV